MPRKLFSAILFACLAAGSTWLAIGHSHASRPIPLPKNNLPVSRPARTGPVIYFFTRSDCVYCPPMHKLANQLHREGHTVYVVNQSRHDLIRKYGVTNYPTFLIVDDKTIVRRVIGLTTKERILGKR